MCIRDRGGTFLASLLAVPVVLYIHTYAGKSRLANYLRLTLDVMWGCLLYTSRCV